MSEGTRSISPIPAMILAMIVCSLPGCHKHGGEHHPEEHTIVLTSPKARPVTITQVYVCQIHSQRHIKVRALENGYLEEILVREGQAVKKDEVMFRIIPVLYQAELNAATAERDVAQLKRNNTERLFKQNVVAEQELKLMDAELERAQAKMDLAKGKLRFTKIVAPFDGIIDKLLEREGSLVEEGDMLTTLSDNSVMWVYFNVPERDYLEYMAGVKQKKANPQIELTLADGSKFNQIGEIGAIEAKFNNETGNIPFRADFKNPERLLRHGQTGNVVIRRVQEDAIIIPQRASFEVLDKRYVWVVGKDDVAHQREIAIQNELEDLFVIKRGIEITDRIVLEGGRQIQDGKKLEYEFRSPEVVMGKLKNKAE